MEPLIGLLVPLFSLIVLYWVIRLAVRHAVLEAHHRLDRERANEARPAG